MILPKERDPRLVTVRRGGTLTDGDHQRLARWAADCARHVLPAFEAARPGDGRPAEAIRLARAWAAGEVAWATARQAAFAANAAGRGLPDAARFAALAAGQAGAVGHVAAHALGAAAYAIRCAMAAAAEGRQEAARRRELAWQRRRLPAAIRDLVLDDQRRRNALCWSVFA